MPPAPVEAGRTGAPAKASRTEATAFSADDLYRYQHVSEAHCRRDGGAAVATVRSVDRDNDRFVSRVWMFPLDGTPARALTQGTGLDRSPCWSPEGTHVAFLSDRDGGVNQVHILDMAGGEARRCGMLAGGVTALRWSLRGDRILASAIVQVDAEQRGRPTDGKVAQRAANAPEVVWRLPYKADGVGYLLSRQIHLFDLDATTGTHRQLTSGAFDVLGFEVSPDGQRVAFVRTREGRYAHRAELWLCDRNGTQAQRILDRLATITQPRWSPDGRYLAFSGAEHEGDGQSALYAYDLIERTLRCLGGEDLEVAAIPDAVHWVGREIVFARALRGCHVIARIAPGDSDAESILGGERQLGALACSDSEVVFSAEHPAIPSDLHARSLRGGAPRRVSDLNAWWRERTPLEAKKQRFDVPDGLGGTESIEGWIVRARDGRRPQPLLSDVHGGPASYALLDFESHAFWHVLCSRGWTVLALNAVGSASYGREFCSRLNGRWGELDLPQHLAALHQLQAEGVADARMAICGKSYGGYLSAWATGHDERFRAAVVMAPVGNIETHYGTSDGGYYADPLYLATAPVFDRKRARELSPLQYIEKSTTPTLLLQGKEDERCPKCQSEEMFVSLYRAGETETELVLYPGEGHDFLGGGKPACRADAVQRIVDWVSRHTESAGVTAQRLGHARS
jgi:dipeptidyl aminopeptidase/acylaminoacyl peptidase